MENRITSAQALTSLGVQRVDDLPAYKVVDFFRLFNQMALPEQEQLIGAVRDFPRLIENGMTGFKENARHAFQGNEESMRQFYEACNHVLQCLHEMWQTENFCEMGPLDIMEARMKITSQMIKILDMMKDMDVENKKFLAEEHEKGDSSIWKTIGAAAGIVGAVAIAFFKGKR